MSKIIKVVGDVVFVGVDNGQVKEVRKSDCEFEPVVGTEVEIFESETSTIVHKVTKPVESNADKGINIKIENANTNNPGNVAYVSGKVVDKVTYLLLAFFLGWIGVHKFYAGKIGAGIMFVVFCWTGIPAIISFIEFIVAIFKKPDIHGKIVV